MAAHPLGLGHVILMPIIVDFLETYPDIKVRMIPTDQKLVWLDEVDLAVRIQQVAEFEPGCATVRSAPGELRQYHLSGGSRNATYAEDLLGHDSVGLCANSPMPGHSS